MNGREMLDVLKWIDVASKGMKYGEVAVRLYFHDGNLKRWEKTVTEKIQPEDRASD